MSDFEVHSGPTRRGRGFPLDEAAYLLRTGVYLPDYPIELVASAWQENYDRLYVENQRLREAISDVLADLTPGISPWSVLEGALRDVR